MDESKATKFADKLMIIVDDFKASAKRHKKRKEDSPSEHRSHRKAEPSSDDEDARSKRPRLEEANGGTPNVSNASTASSDQPGLATSESSIPSVATLVQANQSAVNYPFSSPGQLTAAKIKDMMASAQRMIAQRKMEIGFQEVNLYAFY